MVKPAKTKEEIIIDRLFNIHRELMNIGSMIGNHRPVPMQIELPESVIRHLEYDLRRHYGLNAVCATYPEAKLRLFGDVIRIVPDAESRKERERHENAKQHYELIKAMMNSNLYSSSDLKELSQTFGLKNATVERDHRFNSVKVISESADGSVVSSTVPYEDLVSKKDQR